MKGKCLCDEGFDGILCGSSSCGSLGEPCCPSQICNQGTCVSTSSDMGGVCSSYGGMFVQFVDKRQKVTCASPNFFTGDCSCNGLTQNCYITAGGEFYLNYFNLI